MFNVRYYTAWVINILEITVPKENDGTWLNNGFNFALLAWNCIASGSWALLSKLITRDELKNEVIVTSLKVEYVEFPASCFLLYQ